MPERPVDSDSIVMRLLTALHQDLLSKPGRVREVHQRAGLDPNYARQRLRKGTMDLAKFCRLVEVSGKNLSQFVAEAVGDLDKAGESRSPLPSRPEGEEPAWIRQARMRANAAVSSSPIPRSHLERMDDLRYDDPAQAKVGVESVIDFINPHDVPFALGVYSSCCRALLLPRDAWFAIHTGLDLARGLEQLSNQTNLWQRASIVLLGYCKYERALASSERATAGYARLGDLSGVGRTLIDQGTILWEMDRLAESEEAFRSGLELLSPSDLRNQCAAHQNLAVLLQIQGKSLAALETLSSAVPLASSTIERGKLNWLQALCLAGIGRPSEALESFNQAFELLMTSVPADAAQLVCDQVRFLIECGRLVEGLKQARAIRSLIIPLEDRSPRIAAAVRDLATIEIQSTRETALALVDDVQRRIRQARRPLPAGPHPSSFSSR